MKRIVSIFGWYLVSLLMLLLIKVEANAAWLDPAWTLRSSVTISYASGSTLTNFQVHINLDSSFDFARAKSDGSDVRITAADGTTALPFWIESWNQGGTTASLWVNVNSISSPGGTTLYLYYGNASAVTASNGDNTFMFFDDFEIKTTGTTTQSGYFNLGSPQTVLSSSQGWEATSPHNLSVIPAGGSNYWGYYGLQDGCGAVGLAYSNDLVTWTKYTGNPLFTNGRWPSVLKVGSTINMVYEKDFCATTYIVLATSTTGSNFTDVKSIVALEPGFYNQNPNLFDNTARDSNYYIYWFRGDQTGPGWDIRVRSAPTITGLDTGTETTILSSSTILINTLAAPNMIYYGGRYYLTVEVLDGSGLWNVLVFESNSPTSGFTLVPGNPLLVDGAACNFQHVVGTTLHDYYCKLTGSTWTLEHRSANLAAGRKQIIQHAVDSGKWLSTGGNWGIVQDTQPDGSVGAVAQGFIGTTDERQLLNSTTTFAGSDYVLEAHGKQLVGGVWGLGVKVNDQDNLDIINLYNSLDATNNLYVYNMVAGSASTEALTALGPVDANTWYKLTVKEHSNLVDVYKDDVLKIASATSPVHGDSIALYGEANNVSEFDNVLVRKYAATEPSATVTTDTVAPTVSAFIVTTPTTTRNIPVTTFTATDTVGVTGYLITTSSVPPVAGASGWAFPAPTIYTVVSDGTFTLYPWAKDNAGNVSSVFGSPRTVVVDTVVPTVTAFTVTSPSTSRNIPITSFTATDTGGSGIASYMVTTSSTQPTSGAAGWAGTAPTTYTVASDGTFTLYPWAKDNAGNVSSVFGSPRTVVVDTVLPTVTAFLATSPSASRNIPITSFTATDTGGSGIASYMVTTSSTQPTSGAAGWAGTAPTTYTVASDATYTLYPWAKDVAGNVSTVFGSPRTVVVDTVPPDTSITSQPTNPSNQTSASFSFTATEAGSTFACQIDGGGYSTCTTPKTYSSLADGITHTFTVRATDPAGNPDPTPATYSWLIDTTVPNPPNISGTTPTNNTTPTWNWTSGGNGGSGIYRYVLDNSGLMTGATPTTTATSYTAPTQTEGTHTLYVEERNTAGSNWSAPGSFAIVIDITAPTVSISAPSSAVGNSGTPVTYTVTYSGADAVTLAAGNVTLNTTGNASGSIAVTGSGTSTRTVTISNITGNGTIGISIVAGTASDLAGNATAAAGPSATFTVDNSSGDFDGNGVVDMIDALKALNFAVGLETPTALDIAHGDVAPLVNGIPHPDGKIDLADVIAILRKAVGLPSW